MNTRGLTELIVLNIALNAEIIGLGAVHDARDRTMVRTVILGPLLRLIDPPP